MRQVLGENPEKLDIRDVKGSKAALTFLEPGTLALAEGQHPLSEPPTAGRTANTQKISAEMLFLWLEIAEITLLSGFCVLCAIFYLGAEAAFGEKSVWGAMVIGTGLYAFFRFGRIRPRPYEQTSTMAVERLRDYSITFALMLIIAFLLKNGFEFSRAWAIMSYIGGAFLIVGFAHIRARLLNKAIQSGNGLYRIALYGSNESTKSVMDRLAASSNHLVVDAVMDLRRTRLARCQMSPIHFSSPAELTQFLLARQIDGVVMNIPHTAGSRILEVKRILEEVNVDIFLAPPAIELNVDHCEVAPLGRLQTLAFYRRPVRGIGLLAKTAFDRCGAFFALILLAPLLLAAAMAVKLDTPGPALFSQKRKGFNNQSFTMLKFRTMHTHQCDDKGDMLTRRNDSRVTRIGQVLRRTSMDELPQLINILRGEMSFVGPRPHAYGAKAGDRPYEDVVARYSSRYRMRPGLTGLAQIRGHRGNTHTEQDLIDRVESDFEYMSRWTLWVDFEIILRTILAVMFQKNAF
ncbi:MAG: exopolysaccharide biosynthesis polyprenyl glycosylphosphotransferase [Pseudomonadota bacterium]